MGTEGFIQDNRKGRIGNLSREERVLIIQCAVYELSCKAKCKLHRDGIIDIASSNPISGRNPKEWYEGRRRTISMIANNLVNWAMVISKELPILDELC